MDEYLMTTLERGRRERGRNVNEEYDSEDL